MARQTEIAGFEAPKNADIEAAIDAWLEAKDEQRYATERTKLRHAGLLVQMQKAGIDAYPFVDAKNGKRKQVVIARDPKAKALKAPRPSRKDADIGDEVEMQVVEHTDDPSEPAVDNVIEMRRVKRTAEHEAMTDPFGSTRAAMNDETPTKKNSVSKRGRSKRGK